MNIISNLMKLTSNSLNNTFEINTMLNILPVSVLLEICKYLKPTDFVKLFVLSKQLNNNMSADLFWSCKYANRFDIKNRDNLKPKEKYKQKLLKRREKIFKEELQGYSVTSSAGGKTSGLSYLFGAITDSDFVNPKIRIMPKSTNRRKYK